MNRLRLYPMVALLLAMNLFPATAYAQRTPSIGCVYPAGGRAGSTFEVSIGGQFLDGVSGAVVTGEGVSAQLLHYYYDLSPQDMMLLREQLKVLKKAKGKSADNEHDQQIADLENRISRYVLRPASAALANIVILQVKISPDAVLGKREIQLVTPQGVTNPMTFYVGKYPEWTREAMKTSVFQVLGKEALAQRKRPPELAEVAVQIPATLNGQIASGEVNRYRFDAQRGQSVTVSVRARELVPYIADAVPGWFHSVIHLHDAAGKEVAYADAEQFNQDPTLHYVVPHDGPYVLSIHDAIYRGREDFVYRITLHETAQEPGEVRADAFPLPLEGMTRFRSGSANAQSEIIESESSDLAGKNAQSIPINHIVSGRMDRQGDEDIFRIQVHQGMPIIIEVMARRLGSPLDSQLMVTDQYGTVIGVNDDANDAATGMQTHHADSYIALTPSQDDTYFVHLRDATGAGGPEYVYQLRISEPQPGFELRVVPQTTAIVGKRPATMMVYAIRHDGFDGTIDLKLKDPPKGLGFSISPTTIEAGTDRVKVAVRSKATGTGAPISLTITGQAKIGKQDFVVEAVPAEDRMQAFLWRHLVPREELFVVLSSPERLREPTRELPPESMMQRALKRHQSQLNREIKFSQKQVASQLRRLSQLYQEGLLSEDFYADKVAQCDTAEE